MKSALSEQDLSVIPIDREQKDITLGADAKKNIHVFNESYIDENIRISGEGLDTIVLFGEQIDVEQQIDDIFMIVLIFMILYQRMKNKKLLEKFFV